MSETGHRLLDHTADLALELWAPTQEDLLREGARALTAILTEDAPPESASAATGRAAVALETLDAEDRLVQWLNEVLYLAVTDGFLYRDARLELSEGGLRAELLGDEGGARRIATELKSVTYHDLVISGGADGWRARVVIDV